MVEAMDFGFLFDPTRKLLSIGYRVDDGQLDSGHYDLLASEARLASFVAIAKGDVPVSHWFRLGRALTPGGAGLRPRVLVGLDVRVPDAERSCMRTPVLSLLDQTSRLVVKRQIAYGAERGVPWGVSESAYNARDLEMTYQYSNFGVPGLGLRRGLSEDVVIAPYATGLAAMVDPTAAVRNFRRLARGRGRRARTASTRRSTTPRRGCRKAPRSPWSTPTWRTTRACSSSRSATPSTTA